MARRVRTKSSRQARRKKLEHELDTVNLDAAGIDIGAESIVAAVPKGRTPEGEHVRTFQSFVCSLRELANWLKACGVCTVAMESTGVYWIPLYELLEDEGFEVYLVDARKVKNVSGRKSDVSDAEWLQQLHTFGLLPKTFRPESAICELRAYTRQRSSLVESAARHIQHMHKALNQMRLQLQHVLRDVTGVTGLAIIRAILRGERDPRDLAKLRHERCHNDEATIAKALEGNYRSEHVFALQQSVELYDFYQEKMEDCDKRIERCLSKLETRPQDARPKPKPRTRRARSGNGPRFPLAESLLGLTGVDLTRVPGLGSYAVLQLVGETGCDMSPWKSDKHFTSWLALAPNNKESAGRIFRRATPMSSSRAAKLFRLAACAVRNTQTALGAFYRRIRSRRGAPKAITATARKIATIYFRMLATGEEFIELGQDAYERQYQQRLLSNLRRKATRLRFSLVPDQSIS